MGYQRLTQEERYQISALVKSGLSQRRVASVLNRSASTISRELSRNGRSRSYSPKRAHNRYLKRRRKIHPPLRMDAKTARLVEARLSLQWSPEQISGRLKIEGTIVCHETIYRYIYQQKKLGRDLYQDLRWGRKRRWTHEGRRNLKHPKNNKFQYNQTPIAKRPAIVEKRKRLGDFERDTIKGTLRGPRILTIVDRVSRLTRIGKMSKLSSTMTHELTVKLLRGYKVKTITNDNGQEFARHEMTAKSLRTKVYFNDPYCSWQRGTNENTNGLVRQYFPKGTDFSTVTLQEIKGVERKLNNRPRKCLGYRTPNEVHRRLSQRCTKK